MNRPIPPEIFQTERMILRRPVAADAETIFATWCQDPSVTKYLVWRPHASLQESVDHVRRCQAILGGRGGVRLVSGAARRGRLSWAPWRAAPTPTA